MSPGSPKAQRYNLIFGNLAIIVTFVTVDPLALRPRLSPGLLVSDISFMVIISTFASREANIHDNYITVLLVA